MEECDHTLLPLGTRIGVREMPAEGTGPARLLESLSEKELPGTDGRALQPHHTGSTIYTELSCDLLSLSHTLVWALTQTLIGRRNSAPTPARPNTMHQIWVMQFGVRSTNAFWPPTLLPTRIQSAYLESDRPRHHD